MELYHAVETNELTAQVGGGRQFSAIAVPEFLQRNDPSVIALGVENTGEVLFRALAKRLGRTDLAGLNLLDIGCGVRFAQTLVNRDVPFASYTGIDVWPILVTWLGGKCREAGRSIPFLLLERS